MTNPTSPEAVEGLRSPRLVSAARVQYVEWLGGITGLAGAAALAWPNSYSGWAFAVFLVSNLSWLWYGVKQRLWPMVTMQGGFALINIFGTYNWLILGK